MIDAQCLCGCALVLSHRDAALAARCLAIAGEERHRVPDAVPSQARAKAVDIEPTELVRCPECGAKYAMETYLVVALTSRRAPIPNCTACRNPLRSLPLEHWSEP